MHKPLNYSTFLSLSAKANENATRSTEHKMPSVGGGSRVLCDHCNMMVSRATLYRHNCGVRNTYARSGWPWRQWHSVLLP